MTPFWPEGKQLDLRVGEGGQPASFRAGERLHRVTGISRQWRVHTAWWREGGGVQRQYWELTTDTGYMCVLFFDVARQAWFMERVWK
jgi:hypothetical protein